VNDKMKPPQPSLWDWLVAIILGLWDCLRELIRGYALKSCAASFSPPRQIPVRSMEGVGPSSDNRDTSLGKGASEKIAREKAYRAIGTT